MSADNEKRLRELMGRMVAMSPEPPEFPEEIAMAEPRHIAKRRRPALTAALAAAAVLILAVPLLIWNVGREDPAVTTTQVPSPTTTVQTTPTTEPAIPTTTTVPAPVEVTGVIYLILEPENSFLGNPALVPFTVMAEDTTGLLVSGEPAVSLLTKIDDLGALLPADFQTVIPAGVEVVAVSGQGGEIALDMSEEFLAGAGGSLADLTMLNQLVYTATYSNDEARVRFTVAGRPVSAYGSEGLDLTEPVGRETFIEELNNVFLTEPFRTGGDGLPLVQGMARVFEATVSLFIVDDTGSVLFEDHQTATDGAPAWGQYQFFLDTPTLEPGNFIQVFQASAEDGRPTDVVTIPILEHPGGIWDLTP